MTKYAIDIISLMTDSTQGKAMQLPATGWAAMPYNGGVNSPEIDEFVKWLETLDHQFEWHPAGLIYKALDTGETHDVKCGEYIILLHNEHDDEVILVLNQHQFNLLFAVLSQSTTSTRPWNETSAPVPSEAAIDDWTPIAYSMEEGGQFIRLAVDEKPPATAKIIHYRNDWVFDSFLLTHMEYPWRKYTR